MTLKSKVDMRLKEMNRPFRWLAFQMEKTEDGLKLSLIRGSIKYNDIIKLCEVLDVRPEVLFPVEDNAAVSVPKKELLEDYKKMIAMLREQIKEKSQIIDLMTRR